jgi:hypothetical protein
MTYSRSPTVMKYDIHRPVMNYDIQRPVMKYDIHLALFRGIGSNARQQAFGHPVGVHILALRRVRGDQQANDTPRPFTRNERPSADIVSTT